MISVSIITKNEEKNISRCLDSLSWSDDIIIVDSGSTDKTLNICKKFQCKIIRTEWLGFGRTKQIGVNHAKYDWVFSIDADEEVSKELSENIKSIVKNSSYKGFFVKRKSFYLGRQINYSGWQNDFPLRLFNKKYGNFNSRDVHEKVVMRTSEISRLDLPIIHYPYNDIEAHLKKINLYTSLGSIELFNKRKKVLLIYPFLAAFFKFLKTFIIKKGFLDGKEGLILSILSSFYVFLKYIKLWLLNKK